MWKKLTEWFHEHYRRFTSEKIAVFIRHLREEEYSEETVKKYLRAVQYLAGYAQGRPVTRELSAAWKAQLEEAGYAPRTVNAYIAGANRFFAILGWKELHLKAIRIQQSAFRRDEKMLSRRDYESMVRAAEQVPASRLMLMTLGSTGIRESELRFFTAEAAEKGSVQIYNKGKVRDILLPDSLQEQLISYCRARGITSGPVFRTRTGRAIHRSVIWSRIKRIGIRAQIGQQKAYPHNLRKLFAHTWYEKTKDIAGLAAMMGHSSINTTRIYIAESGSECRRRLDELHLVWK